MTEPLGGQFSGEGTLSARVTVTYTGGWGWESRWLLVTRYLARLKELYGGAPMDSNTDLWAIVNSFMIDCFHLTEAFSHGAGLAREAKAAADASPSIQLCRDYANTWKHLHRDRNCRVVYIWRTGDSDGGGRFVELGHRLRDEPDAAQTTVDGYDVARKAWQDWRSFMTANRLPELTDLTQPYLKKLLA